MESGTHVLKRHRVHHKFDISDLPHRASQAQGGGDLVAKWGLLHLHGLEPSRLLSLWDFSGQKMEWVAIFFSE